MLKFSTNYQNCLFRDLRSSRNEFNVNRIPRHEHSREGKVFGPRPRTPLNISLSDTGETWEGRNISSLFSRCQAQLQLVIRISGPYFNIRARRRVSPEIHFTLCKPNDDEYTYGNGTHGINVAIPNCPRFINFLFAIPTYEPGIEYYFFNDKNRGKLSKVILQRFFLSKISFLNFNLLNRIESLNLRVLETSRTF